MRNIADVHGTFHSFKELGVALRAKMSKEKVEPKLECKKCGKAMRHIKGTNTYVCDYATMEDAKLPNGKDVQVFTKCGNIITV